MNPRPTLRPRRWLLLRGLVREQRHWHGFPDHLARALGGPQVSCLDLPGAGTEHRRRAPWSIGETAEDLRRRWPSDQGGARWGILGISLGGMVALDWAGRHPGDFAAVVVVNTSAGDESRPWERLDWRRYATVVRAALSSDRALRERSIIDLTINSPAVDRAALAGQHAALQADRPVSDRTLLAQLVAASRSRLPAALQAPLLVLASRGDRLVRTICSERIAARYGAPIRLHDSAGHDLPFDAPDWLAGQVQDWLGDAP